MCLPTSHNTALAGTSSRPHHRFWVRAQSKTNGRSLSVKCAVGGLLESVVFCVCVEQSLDGDV